MPLKVVGTRSYTVLYQVDNWRKAETRNRVSGTNRGCLGLKHEKDSAEIVGAL